MAEYINRESAIETIMSEPTDAHYPHWYADKIKAIPAADVATVRRWIPVTERLPKDDSDVLAYLRIGEEGRIYPANYAKGVWWDCIFNTPATKTTTHWMPLPKPPKEERP